MASDDSWIDRDRVRALARRTTWREAVPAPASRPPVSAAPEPLPPLGAETREQLGELLAESRRATGLSAGAVLRGADIVIAQGDLELAFMRHVPEFLRWLEALDEGEGTPPGHLALQLGARFVITTWHGTSRERFVLLLEGTTPPQPELLTELGLALHDALA